LFYKKRGRKVEPGATGRQGFHPGGEDADDLFTLDQHEFPLLREEAAELAAVRRHFFLKDHRESLYLLKPNRVRVAGF
jgi:hypothetical protein